MAYMRRTSALISLKTLLMTALTYANAEQNGKGQARATLVKPKEENESKKKKHSDDQENEDKIYVGNKIVRRSPKAKGVRW